MNKLAVISTVILCFLIYTVEPLLFPIFLLSITSVSAISAFTLLIWGGLVITQLVCIYQINKKNKKWLHIFFFLMFISIFLSTSDDIIWAMESSKNQLKLSNIIDKLLFPLLAMWVVNFSDAKDFFNKEIKSIK